MCTLVCRLRRTPTAALKEATGEVEVVVVEEEAPRRRARPVGESARARARVAVHPGTEDARVDCVATVDVVNGEGNDKA